jgi:hypothetical protein
MAEPDVGPARNRWPEIIDNVSGASIMNPEKVKNAFCTAQENKRL